MTTELARIEVGQEFPLFERVGDFAHWNRYAAVNDEFVAMHMDDDAGRGAGYPKALGMGNLTWAYFHVAIHRWLGDGARVARISVQFRGAVTRGESLLVGGRVTAVRGKTIELDVWADTRSGAHIAPGSATVQLPD